MAASKKRIKSNFNPPQDINNRVDPDGFYQKNPTWCFGSCDKEAWCFDADNVGDFFWSEILPHLKSLETQTWQEILVQNNKKNHNIGVEDLNKCAQKRLISLCIEQESITSLRLNGTHRIYGYIIDGVFYMLWYDKEHGDNSDCVCRSHKKHT